MPCAVGIRTARSVLQEVPEASSSSIAHMAKLDPDRNTERGTQRVAKTCKLTLPIPMANFQCGDEKLPFLPGSGWIKFLASRNLWHVLSGLERPDPPRCEAIWREFWKRYKLLCPSHSVFQRRLPLHRTVGLILHGDEGRSRRKTAILVVSLHSAVGFGIRPANERSKVDDYVTMRLNYMRNTWTTRYLLGVLPKSFYENDYEGGPDCFQDFLWAITEDLKTLTIDGVEGPDGQKFYGAILNTAGDWPWIAKAGNLSRSFANVSK